MNTDLQSTLIQPIAEYMDRFDAVYQDSLKSDVKLINTVIDYLSKKKPNQKKSPAETAR